MCKYCEERQPQNELNKKMKALRSDASPSGKKYINISKPNGKTLYSFEADYCHRCGRKL